MVALLQYVWVSIERVWLKIVNALSLVWAVGHCFITAHGTQEQRYLAAAAGVFGAIVILITLNLTVRRIAEREMREAAIREGLDEAVAFLTVLRADSYVAQDEQR